MNDDKNIPPDTEAYYETVASQEEIYLEEAEEEVREILISDDPSPSQNRGGEHYGEQGVNCSTPTAASLDEQLTCAAEELITGDADDPPLREEVVVETLKMISDARRIGST